MADCGLTPVLGVEGNELVRDASRAELGRGTRLTVPTRIAELARLVATVLTSPVSPAAS